MAENVPVRYKVTVNKWFKAHNMMFRPPETDGPKKGYPNYRVPPHIYDGSVEGVPFKDLCATVEPEFAPE